MAPTTRQKGRNYRRKQPSNSSPEDFDREFQHPSTPPPRRVAVDVAHLISSSADFGGSNISYATLKRVIGHGAEGREGEPEGGRSGEEGKEGVEGEEEAIGTGGKDADGEVVAPPGLSPNQRADSSTVLTKKGLLQNGAKRIGSGVGYDMLKSMGWRENTGLGQSSNGILDPILPTPKPNHLGIGFNPTVAHDAAQEEIRQIQKAKREERDQKLQQKLEKAEAAEEEAMFMRESSVAVPSTPYEDQGTSLPQHSRPAEGDKPTEPGQCPHCKQRFDTKHSLKSHINARHARLLLAVKRQLKTERRHDGRRRGGGSKSMSGRGQSARSLAPLSQDFSVYD